MIEGLFVLTTVFIAYVVYQIANEPKANVSETSDAQVEQPVAETLAEPEPSEVVAETVAAPVEAEQVVAEVPAESESSEVVAETVAAPVEVEQAVETPVEEPESPAVAEVAPPEEISAPAEATENKSEAEVTPPPAEHPSKAGLKNPKTGEVVLVYNNYRFLKRWIKEALVSEGLLPKIYKNNELNAGTETKIKAALEKLEAIDKYRV